MRCRSALRKGGAGRVAAAVSLVAAVTGGGACSGTTTSAAERPPNIQPSVPSLAAHAGPASDNAPPDGDRRLSDVAVPTAYRLSFDIDPAAEFFAGVTEIDVRLSQPSRRVDLHASKLEITEVAFRTLGNTGWQWARVEHGQNHGLAVHLPRQVSGEVSLRFVYRAGLEETPESFYRVREGERWYMFSQLEAQMAREAFPCFDEPRFKTPFTVTISAPAGLTVLANTPAEFATSSVATADVPPSAVGVNVSPGRQTVQFRTTPPMPTYLVAAAVGPFERTKADLAGFGKEGDPLPHSIYTVAGKSSLTAYAASVTPPILRSLTQYLGSPYPYPKLDQIAVPNFQAGAMENVGLVTYRENILLLDAKRSSERDRAVSRSIIAHELAHMWFGNWVTAAWWDDIWLNEAFATWMAAKVMTEIAPELETPVWSLANMLDVMQEDASSSSQPIRKVITGGKDVDSAFDGITYQKGFAVLRMIENWMGPDAFQRAVRRYLSSKAWGAATMADFVDALDAETELPVREVASSFIEQAGIPVLSVEAECQPREKAAPGAEVTLDLAQRRYVPLGAGALPEAASGQTWVLPACLTWLGAKGTNGTYCTVLSEARQSVKLELAACPEAWHPNTGELGYYHVALGSSQLRRLTDDFWPRLRVEERIGLVKHSTALLQSGELDLTTYTHVLRRAARDDHRLVLDSVILGLDLMATWVEHGGEGTEERRRRLAAFTTELLGGHARRLGPTSKPHDVSETKLKRASVIAAVGRLAPTPALQRAADVAMRGLLARTKPYDLE